MGRRTLVEQALIGEPPVQRKLDGDGRVLSDVQAPQPKSSRDREASPLEDAAAPIAMLDLFGRRGIADTCEPMRGERSTETTDTPRVQRKPGNATDDVARDGTAVTEIAGRGVSGTGSPLPHLEQIQARFGHHDVSGVQAHQGAAAATSANELGARAYAYGNAVAFAGSPDLYTAAHEAAHVVQQRGGVQLKGGIDQPGDDYERHADAVADAVVAGRPAAQMLDQVAGTASSGVAAIQRKTDDAASASAARQRRTAEIYLAANQRNVWATVGEHARSVYFPGPAARLSWTDQRGFVRELLMQLEANISDFTPLAKLDEILYPSDAMRVIGELLPPTDAWSPPLGLAIAQALQIAIVSSLHRLGPRYLTVADSTGSAGEGVMSPGALVYSMPIDRYVGTAMCTPRILTIEPPDRDAAAKAKGRPTGLRPTKLAWEGARDPHVWNWVRATDPADATAEEVAAALWTVTDHHGETNAGFNAYLLAAAPPLFGIPKKFAIKNPNARQYAPANALRGEDSVDAELIDVAASSAGDAIALHESPDAAAAPSQGKPAPAEPPPDLGAVLAMLEDCHLQLAFVTSEVATWGLGDRIKPAISFVMRKQSELATDDARTLSGWNRVISDQRDLLFKISGAIHNLASTAPKLGITDPKAPEAAPVREILELLATSAGTSQLAQTSEAKLQQALELQAGLNVRAVRATERDLESAHLDFSATMGPKDGKGMAGFSREVVALQDKSRQLQTTMINGGEVDTTELDEVTLRSGEIALRERVLGTIHSTFELQEAAMSAKEGIAAHIAMLFSGKFRSLENLCQHVRDHVVPIQNEMIATEQRIQDEERSQDGTPDQKAKHRATRRAVLAKAQAEFAKISLDEDLRTFFREGAKLVQNQQFRTACVKAAALIGIAVLAAATGGAAAELAGGMLMEAEGVATVAELSTVARIGVTTANVVADSAVNAVAQSSVQGGSLKEAFIENLFMSFASTALFGTIARASSETARLEGREAMTWAKAETFAQKAFVVGRESGAIAVHTVWGAAIGYVAHRVVGGHEPSPMEARDWLLQGASVAIGRGVHKALGARMPGLERLAKRSAEATRLVAEAKQVQQLALTVEHSKNADSAVELLDRRTRLLHDEIEAINEVVAKDGDASGELGKARKDLDGQIHESNTRAMLETKFHLLGLEELVPGALWRGPHEQVQRAVDEARRSGANVSHDAHAKRWKLAFDGRGIEIQEAAPAADQAVGAKPRVLGGASPHQRGVDERMTDHNVSNGVPDREVPAHEQVTQKIIDPSMAVVEPLASERPTLKMAAVEPELTHAADGSIRVMFLGSGDTAAESARMVKPLPGYVDVFVHAESDGFLLLHKGEWIPVKANSVRQLILKNPAYRKGQAIRLIACETGSPASILAQSIADGLGTHVIAPTGTIWAHPDGRLTIGPTDLDDTGHWMPFEPHSGDAPRGEAPGSPSKPGEAAPREHTEQSREPAGPQDQHGNAPTALGPSKRAPQGDEQPAEHETSSTGNAEPEAKPVAEAGAREPTTLKKAPQAEVVQQAIAAAHGQLGLPIAEGGFGTVYRVPGHPDLAIKLPTNDAGGQMNPQLAKEATSLQRLTHAQVPTAYHGTVEWTDGSGVKHVGILMDYVEGAFSKNVLQQGKLAGSKIPEGDRELLNQRTVSDLVNLRDRCLEQDIDIEDLQFMVSRDGSIRMIDPARATWLGDAKMTSRQIRERMKRFEKRINTIINDVREIVRKNTDRGH